MSTVKMLDMCVRFIARRHHLLTDEHVAILDNIWDMYEPSLPPLPPSPPPERQHVHFVEHERPDKEERPKRPSRPSWPCYRCIDQEVWECGQCDVREPTQEEVENERVRQEQQEEEGRRLSQEYLRQEEEKYQTYVRQQHQSQQPQQWLDHQDACDCSDCEYDEAENDPEWQDKRRATLADFAALKKEAEYQAQLQEEAEEQEEYYRQQREEQEQQKREEEQQEREEEQRKWQEYYQKKQDDERRKWQEQEEERQWRLDTLWRQVPQGVPVSQPIEHKETCGCETCEWQDRRRAQEEAEAEAEQEQEYRVPRCSDYLRTYDTCDADRCTYECGAACGSSAPQEQVIDLTCEKESCQYGCDGHPGPAYPLPPLDSCLYGCAFTCGAKLNEHCKAEYDAEGNQLPPVVESVVNTAIDSDDDMPPLISFAELARQKGLLNPEAEEAEETEIVDVAPPAQPKPPKAKPLFPYNHPRWPSPRAKALVQWMIRRGRTSKDAISYALKQPGEKSIKTLTHDICMRYLAKVYGLTHEQLMEKTIYELHNPDKHTPYWHICPCSFCKGGYSRGYKY